MWGLAYDIGVTPGGTWWAMRCDGLGWRITAGGPEELWAKVSADYTVMPPVPREAREGMA